MRQKKTKQMLDYWMDLYQECGNSPENHHRHIWPDRSDVLPAQCRSLLGEMFILDTSNGEAKYRLAGTKLCGLYGRELKLERFSHAYDDTDELAVDNWASRLAEDDYLALLCSTAFNEDRQRLNLETLLMPLSHNGRTGQRVLGITVACEAPAWLGTKPLVSQTIRSVRVLHPWIRNEINKSEEQGSVNTLSFPKLHFGASTPPMSTAADQFLTRDEIMGKFKPNRKVAHLTVIDGGKRKA